MKPLVIAVLGLLVPNVTASTTTSYSVYATTTPTAFIASTTVSVPETTHYTRSQIKTLLEAFSGQIKPSTSTIETMLDVINCESGFRSDVISPTDDFGIVQINQVWGFTKEQMFDVTFSLKFMLQEFPVHPTYWVCYGLVK